MSILIINVNLPIRKEKILLSLSDTFKLMHKNTLKLNKKYSDLLKQLCLPNLVIKTVIHLGWIIMVVTTLAEEKIYF